MDEFEISEHVLRLPRIPNVVDAQRNQVHAYGPPASVGIVAFDPGSSQEPRTADHERVITTPTIYAPHGTPFKPADLCIARGRVYEVDGDAAHWEDEYGDPVGDVVKLRRVDG
ncbi:hypothetical protein ACWGOE_07280 [Leucobacter chromiiresistens]